MKVALVHDYLNQYGGGERVLETLMEMFPEAPVYTLMYDEAATRGRFRGRVRGTSFLDFPFARRHHRLFIPLMPLAVRTMTIDNDYDLIISDSAGFGKGIMAQTNADLTRLPAEARAKAGTYADKRPIRPIRHISYIHTPLRYAWEADDYLSAVMSPVALTMSRPLLNYLKRWDYKAAQKPDILIANSKFIAGKIKKYYGREAEVIYPPVHPALSLSGLTGQSRESLDSRSPIAVEDKLRGNDRVARDDQRYYLAVGRLLHYKRFDLVVDAFAKLGLPLKIVGEGPEQPKLKMQTAKCKSVELLPFVESEDELRKLYAGAKALIFPQVEDFGLVAAEALSCGTPVIAYAAGGAKEIVEDGSTSLTTSGSTSLTTSGSTSLTTSGSTSLTTSGSTSLTTSGSTSLTTSGLFFDEQTPEALADAVRRFETLTFDRRAIARRAAERFGKERFKREFEAAIERVF